MKFKAWSIKKKEWLHDTIFSKLMIDSEGRLYRVQRDSCEVPFDELHDFVLVRFTGAPDKDGKEINEPQN